MILLDVTGSFIGGLIGYLLRGGDSVQSSGWIGSVVGAIILLAICIKRGKFIEQASAVAPALPLKLSRT